MKTKYTRPTLIVLLLNIMFSSCTLIYFDERPIPQKGQVALTTDWSKRSSGIAVPASYTVNIDGQAITCTDRTTLLPQLTAGSYSTLIYNQAEKISIAGTKASVAITADVADPAPGWMFSAVIDIVFEDETNKNVTALMQQQVRQLSIELTVREGDPNRIQSITAELEGIATQLDITTNEHSVMAKVIPVFTRTTDKLSANLHLLGITGTSQKLTLSLRFIDGKTQTIEKELSSLLLGFNTEKQHPMRLAADLNTPTETGFEATITAWKAQKETNGTAW